MTLEPGCSLGSLSRLRPAAKPTAVRSEHLSSDDFSSIETKQDAKQHLEALSWFLALKADLDAVTSYAWNEYAKMQHLHGFERDLEAIVQEMSTVLSHLQAIQVRASVLSFDESEVAAIERNERQWAKQLHSHFRGAQSKHDDPIAMTASTCEGGIALYEKVVATMKARVPAGDYQLHELALMLSNHRARPRRFARNYEQVCPSPTQTLLTIVSAPTTGRCLLRRNDHPRTLC